MDLTACQNQQERLQVLADIVPAFRARAAQHDREASLPYENFKELKAAKYPALTVPKKYGGQGLGLADMLELQETIAHADGSTALSIGWHMGLVKQLGESGSWPEDKYAAVARDVVNNGALLNGAASEPATGSPTRGGRPETTATKTDSGWTISGRKTFTTLAPMLDYFIVSAGIADSDQVGNFLVHHSLSGVSVAHTWDALGMRATGSDDLVLENVQLKDEDYVQTMTPQKDAAGWLLHIPVCYLGIAEAALDYSADYAQNYSPNSIEGTIADLPNIKQKIGEAELMRQRSRHFLYSVAHKWDRSDGETRQQMKTELGAAKHVVVNDAVEIVDLAMRVAGAKSLQPDTPLGRYYRDVRAGLHNPPMDDMTIMQLASDVYGRN
ncbi:acyl-CoA dehydrogenase family protein [Natribacillus halophilus]|uniref:Acyl-CoA dehydrogenase n=1 Tax=Natribacillus halophilus TaxID=549003 RepID=A0A1G8QC12_9BACI|nr:acyl-CoA dehydrogenase family protein [Natribacillus halophilus]SDJ02334.1 Acyl-CoA dehydrogenase [Natribacillus halophilus]